jgi:hypothetical protein
MFESGNLDLAL